MFCFKRLLYALWTDEIGVILSAEAALLGTVAVIGATVGLGAISRSVDEELTEVAMAFRSLDQSYYIEGQRGCSAWTAGSCYEQPCVAESREELREYVEELERQHGSEESIREDEREESRRRDEGEAGDRDDGDREAREDRDDSQDRPRNRRDSDDDRDSDNEERPRSRDRDEDEPDEDSDELSLETVGDEFSEPVRVRPAGE